MRNIALRQMITVQEVADHYGLGVRTVRRWIAAGKLPAYRFGGHLLRVDVEDVEALLRKLPTASKS